jgi:hypothetical protein
MLDEAVVLFEVRTFLIFRAIDIFIQDIIFSDPTYVLKMPCMYLKRKLLKSDAIICPLKSDIFVRWLTIESLIQQKQRVLILLTALPNDVVNSTLLFLNFVATN